MNETYKKREEQTIKEKHPRRRKKRKKKHYLLKFFVIIIIGTGSYYFITSDFFAIQKIAVEDNQYYTKEQVISIAGAKIGRNLFQVSTSNMKDKLLKDPYIKSAKVYRKIPDKVSIRIKERKEKAIIPFGNNYIIIDKEGMILRETSTKPPLTLLTGMTLSNIEPGTPLKVEENFILNRTLEMLEQMEKNEIFFKEIQISNVIVKAYIYDNLICEGTPENILENMDDLQDVLYDLYSKGIERGVIKIGGTGNYSFNPIVE